MERRVVITGLGTINPLGHSAADTWVRARAGLSGIGPLTRFDTADLKTGFGGEVRDFDAATLFGRKEARRMDPVTQYALAAATWALEDGGLDLAVTNREMVGVVMGCGMGNMTTILDGAEIAREKGLGRVSPFYVPMLLADAPAATISITHGLRGPNMAIATACAAGNNAIGEATRMIQRGAADVMLAGGAEAPLLPLVIAAFAATGALSTYDGDPQQAARPFDLDRDGFVVSEGAAILVLEELGHARRRNARIYAEIVGYGTSADAHHVSAPLEDGAGAAAAMRLALQDAGLSPEAISYINAHGTGTQLNDRSETTAIKRVFGAHASAIPVSSTKSIHGHLLGAAGAMEALVCTKALEAQVIPPTINYATPDPTCDLDYVTEGARAASLSYVMSNGFGLGGHNATIILGAFERPDR